jgi:hypothetical protein
MKEKDKGGKEEIKKKGKIRTEIERKTVYSLLYIRY